MRRAQLIALADGTIVDWILGRWTHPGYYDNDNYLLVIFDCPEGMEPDKESPIMGFGPAEESDELFDCDSKTLEKRADNARKSSSKIGDYGMEQLIAKYQGIIRCNVYRQTKVPLRKIGSKRQDSLPFMERG